MTSIGSKISGSGSKTGSFGWFAAIGLTSTAANGCWTLFYFPSRAGCFFLQISKNSLQKQYYCQQLSKCEHSGSKLAAKLIIAMLQPSASDMAIALKAKLYLRAIFVNF